MALNVLVDALRDLLLDALEERLPPARRVREGELLRLVENLLDRAVDDVLELVRRYEVRVLLHGRVLRQDAGGLAGGEVVGDRPLPLRVRRVADPREDRERALEQDLPHDVRHVLLRVHLVRRGLAEVVERHVVRVDGLLRVGVGVREELALGAVDDALEREHHVVSDFPVHRLDVGLAEPSLVLVVALVDVPEAVRDELVNVFAHVLVQPVAELVDVADHLLGGRHEVALHLGVEPFVYLAEAHLLALEPLLQHLEVEVLEGDREVARREVALELHARGLKLREAGAHVPVDVQERPALRAAVRVREHGHADALAHLGGRRVLLLDEELLEHLRTVLDRVALLLELGERALLVVALHGALERLLDAELVVGRELVALVLRDVALLDEALELRLEPADRLAHEHLLALAEEVLVRLRHHAHLLLRRARRLLVDVDALLALGGRGVLDLLVQDVRHRPAEEVVDHRQAPLQLVGDVDRRVGHLAQEHLHVGAGLELGDDAPLVPDGLGAGVPALAVVELARYDEAVDVLLRLLDEVRRRLYDVLRALGVVVHEELHRVFLDLRLLHEGLRERDHVLRQLLAVVARQVDVVHEALARDAEHREALLRGMRQVDGGLHGRALPLDLVVGPVRQLHLLVEHLVRALYESLRGVDDLLDAELRVDELLCVGAVPLRGVVAHVLRRLAHHHREDLLYEELERRPGRAEGDLLRLDVLGLQNLREGGAYHCDVVFRDLPAEARGFRNHCARYVLARVLGVYAVLGLGHEVVEAHEVCAELGLAHLHALRGVRVVDIGVVGLEVYRLGNVDAVHRGLQVLVDELRLCPGEAAAGHRVLEEVLDHHDASGAVVELGVELLEDRLQLAAPEGLAGVDLPIFVFGADDHVPDLATGFAHELQVVLDRGEELLAHGLVVGGADVRAPGERHVDLVVELLELELAVRRLGEADIALVGARLVVHHLAVVVNAVDALVVVELCRRYFL